MDRAEKLAKEVYSYPCPMWYAGDDDGYEEAEKFINRLRDAFVEGHHQAEKDLALTWEDVREIYCLTLNLREHLGSSVFGEPLYQEVLRRFLESKKV